MTVNYVNYSELVADTQLLAQKVGWRPAAVLGIARSGMLPAALLATHFHVPLGEARSFASTGRFFEAGRRLQWWAAGGPVLVVDDTTYAGTTMRSAVALLRAAPYPQWKYQCATVYSHPDHVQTETLSVREIARPRYFAWNFMQHPDAQQWMMDIDGILCADPTAYDDDGPEYVQSLQTAVPLQLPQHQVHTIISCRLERWRPQTETWLWQQGVRWQNLILCPCATADERRRTIDYGAWKGEYYANSPCELLVESSERQAQSAFTVSQKPVLCPALGRILQ